jgi:hypothetical protein
MKSIKKKCLIEFPIFNDDKLKGGSVIVDELDNPILDDYFYEHLYSNYGELIFCPGFLYDLSDHHENEDKEQIFIFGNLEKSIKKALN